MYKRTIRLAPAIPDWTKLKKLPASEKGDPVAPDVFEKISEDKISAGLLIQQKFAEDLCLKLNDQLAVGAKLYKLQVTKLTYAELVSQMSSKFIVQAELDYPGAGMLLSFFGYSLAQALINRLTGGAGEAKLENEEFTPVEKAVFETVLQIALNSLAEGWQNVVPGSPQRISIQTPRFKESSGFSESEEVLIFSAEIGLAEQEPQALSWVYPVKLYTELIQQWLAKPKAKQKMIKLSPVSVSLIDVPVKAALGTAIVSMSDILQLQRGDVIVLDKKVDDLGMVFVGSDARFSAQAGVYNDRLAVQLISPAAKEQAVKDIGAAPLEVPEASKPEAEEPASAEAPAQGQGQAPADAAEEKEEDILDNIEDMEDEDDEDFIWDDEDTLDEDF